MLVKCKFCGLGNQSTIEQMKDALYVQCNLSERKFSHIKERGTVTECYRVMYDINGWGFVKPISLSYRQIDIFLFICFFIFVLYFFYKGLRYIIYLERIDMMFSADII